MNEVPKFAAPQTVTAGPIGGSRKVYAAPKGRPDIRVPFREITLSDPKEPPVRVYDPSGPYTENVARIDLERGLPPGPRALDRRAWLSGDRRPGDPARGQRRRLGRPSDAALPGGTHAAGRQNRPARHPARVRPRRDRDRGNDLCRAPREPGARGGGRGRKRSYRRRRELRGGDPGIRDARIRAEKRWRAAAPSFPPTSITSSSSRWRSAATSSSRSTPTSAIPR